MSLQETKIGKAMDELLLESVALWIIPKSGEQYILFQCNGD